VSSLSKTKVDQLGDRLRKGAIAEGDFQLLDVYRRSFADSYDEIVTIIREATEFEPNGRPAKSTTSIIEKLRRETIRLSQMQDIAGYRLVVSNVIAQNQVVERLKSTLSESVVVDRREQPSFGYRTVQIIATSRNKPIEVQVRTEFQHLWAQLSEKLSDVRDPAIKYGGGDSEIQQTLSNASTLIASLENLELMISGLKSKLAGFESQLSAFALSEHNQVLIADAKAKIADVNAKVTESTATINRRLRELLENAIKSEGGN